MKTRTLILTAAVASLSLVACKKQPPEVAAETTAATTTAEAGPSTKEEAVETMRANFQRVQFDTDSAELSAESKRALNANASIMQRYPDIRIEIEGHADERGTTDYNIALGEKRARTVSKYLVEKGISPRRITVVSYGEERPLDRKPTEMAYTANRRAEFRITFGDAPVSGTTE